MSAENLKGCRPIAGFTKTSSEGVVDHSTKIPGAGSQDPIPLKSVSADKSHSLIKAPGSKESGVTGGLTHCNNESLLALNTPKVKDPGVSGLKEPMPPKVGPCSPAASALLSFHVPAIKSTHTANLDDLAPPKLPPKACIPKYVVTQCGCGRKIVPSTCMSLDCTVCREHVGRRRADSVVRRLKFHKFKPVIYTVFTVPLSARERFYDKREWQKVRLKIWKVLKQKFGARYAYEASHPVGAPVVEKGDIIADTDGQIFHPHLNFLWIQFNGWSPFVDVEMLKKEWAKVLGVEEAVVWTNYSGSPGRVVKWAKYVSRTFPGMHTWTGPARWYGRYPKARKPAPAMCIDCGHPITVVGTISALVVDDWFEREHIGGIDPPWEQDKNINRYKVRSKAGEGSACNRD